MRMMGPEGIPKDSSRNISTAPPPPPPLPPLATTSAPPPAAVLVGAKEPTEGSEAAPKGLAPYALLEGTYDVITALLLLVVSACCCCELFLLLSSAAPKPPPPKEVGSSNPAPLSAAVAHVLSLGK